MKSWLSLRNGGKKATKRTKKNPYVSSGQPIKPEANETLNGEFTMAIY